jgi:hypothetical protein
MSNDDDSVGYKNPPKHTQFQPGQSGNPKGRPKGTKNLATDLSEELSEKIIVTEGGQQHQVSKQRAMIKSLLAKALGGETRASSVLLNLIVGLELAKMNDPEDEVLGEEDQKILEAYAKKLLGKDAADKDKGE